MRTARAWIRSLATLAGLTLLLSGCLKLDVALTISPDDTVDGDLVFAVNKDLVEMSGQSVDELLGNANLPDGLEGATQEPYEDERFVGTRVHLEDVALADLRQGSDPDSLSIERVGDTYEVSGVMDLTTQDADLQGNPFEDQITEAFDTAEIRIAITFPGEVLETNGRVDGTTVTWEPAFGKRTEITAVASAAGNSSGEGAGDGGGASEGSEAAGSSEPVTGGNTALYLILGLVIMGVVAGLFVMLRRRAAPAQASAPSDPPAGAPSDAPTMPTPPPAPPPAPPGPLDPPPGSES